VSVWILLKFFQVEENALQLAKGRLIQKFGIPHLKVMEKKNYLIFKVADYFYALDTSLIVEIVAMPKIFNFPSSAPESAGFINMSGAFIEVIDLRKKFSLPFRLYELSDVVIIIEKENFSQGIIAESILDIVSTEEKNDLIEWREQPVTLFHPTPFSKAIVQSRSSIEEEENPHFKKDDSLKDFTERAHFLAKRQLQFKRDEGQGLLLLKLNDEYYGVELDYLQEVYETVKIVPIPKAPPHFIGFCNLHGKTLLVLDIRQLMGFTSTPCFAKMKILEFVTKEASIGLSADDVENVIFIKEEDYHPLNLASNTRRQQCLKGTALYQGKLIYIIDFNKTISLINPDKTRNQMEAV
jgi:purine-binding chemotaxis protein CheW